MLSTPLAVSPEIPQYGAIRRRVTRPGSRAILSAASRRACAGNSTRVTGAGWA